MNWFGLVVIGPGVVVVDASIYSYRLDSGSIELRFTFRCRGYVDIRLVTFLHPAINIYIKKHSRVAYVPTHLKAESS